MRFAWAVLMQALPLEEAGKGLRQGFVSFCSLQLSHLSQCRVPGRAVGYPESYLLTADLLT